VKKNIFYLLLIVFIFTGCSNNPLPSNVESKSIGVNNTNEPHISQQSISSSQNSIYEPSYEDINLKTDVKDLKVISKKLFDMYLKSFAEQKITDSGRISDYKIEEIKVEKGDIESFQFYVEYSTNPASSNYILAGNGVIEPDGWIRHKVSFVNVKKDYGIFRITGIGTSP
jgi:PBP1b-binding outer membrane lipoprotein LpoB